MITGLFITLIFLLVVLMILSIHRHNSIYDDFEDEVTTHTTHTTVTTTVQDPVPTTAGTITRGWQDNKPYVIDPVDGVTVQLAESDDLYEDADGKIWNLI